MIARFADRIALEGWSCRAPGEYADSAVVQPGIGHDRPCRAAFDHHTSVAVLGQLFLDGVVVAAFDVDGAHRAPPLVAVQLRLGGVEQVNTEPARLVPVPRDLYVRCRGDFDRAEVVAAFVVDDHVPLASVALDTGAPPQPVLVVAGDRHAVRADAPHLAARDDVVADPVPISAVHHDRLHVAL